MGDANLFKSFDSLFSTQLTKELSVGEHLPALINILTELKTILKGTNKTHNNNNQLTHNQVNGNKVEHVKEYNERIQRIKDAYVAHFVLSTMFVEQNAVFRLFEPAIVPVKTNDICLKINLPKRIYLKENLFHTAENSDCTNRPSGLLICLDDFKKDTKPPLVDCLNNGTGCTTQEVDCQPEVTQVSAGALVFRNSHPVYGIDKRQAGHLIRLDQPEVQTELYSWRKYSQIQVAHRVIYGIQTESTNNLISWNAQFDTTKWVKQLRERELCFMKRVT